MYLHPLHIDRKGKLNLCSLLRINELYNVTCSILRSQNNSDSARFHWMMFKFCCSNVFQRIQIALANLDKSNSKASHLVLDTTKVNWLHMAFLAIAYRSSETSNGVCLLWLVLLCSLLTTASHIVLK